MCVMHVICGMFLCTWCVWCKYSCIWNVFVNDVCGMCACVVYIYICVCVFGAFVTVCL